MRVADEHRSLYDAIAQRDVGTVGELVLRHMETGRYLSGGHRPDA